jgi:NADH:ubiquinone oxidoreductase subunit K
MSLIYINNFVFLPINQNFIIKFIVLAIFIGFYGLITNSENLLKFMVFVEIIYLNISYMLIFISYNTVETVGIVFSFFILAIAAAEAVIGFSFLILMLNKKKTILLKDFQTFTG